MRSILIFYIFIFSSCSTEYILESSTNEVLSTSITEDKYINQIIKPYKAGVDSIMNEVLCFSKKEMKKGKPEGVLGNFVTDLCLKMYDSIAEICVMNNGGFRSFLPSGNITRGDIYKLMPFENELVVIELNSSELFELIGYIYSRKGEPISGVKMYSEDSCMILSNRNIFYKKGNNIFRSEPVIASSCSDEEEVNVIRIINKTDKISVLTSDYLANGGDKMIFFNNKEQYKLGIKLRDAIIAYCKMKKEISSGLDNRIQIIKQ